MEKIEYTINVKDLNEIKLMIGHFYREGIQDYKYQDYKLVYIKLIFKINEM